MNSSRRLDFHDLPESTLAVDARNEAFFEPLDFDFESDVALWPANTDSDSWPVFVHAPAMPLPLEIIGLGKTQLRLIWDDETEDTWPSRQLRIDCKCAACQSETTGERILDPDSVSEDIHITHMELVGNYGLAVHFSDGHRTGIYRYSRLRRQQ